MDPIAPFINQAMADVLVAAYKGERKTQGYLVSETGINPTTMQRLLAGKSDIDVIQLTKIADAIGVPPQELMELAVERAERMSAAARTNSVIEVDFEAQWKTGKIDAAADSKREDESDEEPENT